MRVSASYVLTPDEVKRGVGQIQSKQGLLYVWLIAIGFALIGAGHVKPHDVLGPLCIGFAVFWATLIVVGRHKAVARSRGRLCVPVDVVLSDDGFAVANPLGKQEMKWGGMAKVRETSEFFLLYYNRRVALVIPKRAFDTEDLQRVSRILHGAPVTVGV
jgi:hypothetical protein